MTGEAKYVHGAIKSLCVALAVLASVLAIKNAPFAYAKSSGIPPAIRVDSINGQDPATISCPDTPLQSPVTIIGSGEGSTPPGKVEQYGVLIDWGDGSPIEIISNVTFTPPKGNQVDFTFVFETAPHTYTDGSYTISISLFHSEPSGNDNQIDSTVSLDVCTFTPVTPTLQVDSINGQAPSSYSCPDNPPANPITIAGSGQGSAPPGRVELYGVVVDWGDGSPAEETIASFTPPSGAPVNFTYTFQTLAHVYTQDGSYTASLSLVYTDPAGSGDQVVVTQTTEICIRLPRGTVTGEVTDGTTGFPIYGATVEDITDQVPILGSFPGGSVYVVQPPPGLRTIRIRAEGWLDGIAQVNVNVDEVSVLDFVLTQVPTSQNIVGVTLPIGTNQKDKTYLVPESVEAVVDGVVVQTVSVHAGNIYFFVGLPDGATTFRGANTFYIVGSETVDLSTDKKTRSELPYQQVKLQTLVPDASAVRVPVITGGVNGVTSDGLNPVPTSVFATFDYEGLPVTVTAESGSNGVYTIDLIPAGETQVYAYASSTSARSVDTTTTIVGGEFVTENLTVFPFDPETENFVPVISSPTEVGTDEDNDIVLSIDDFSVTDLNDTFSANHTLQVYPGFNYTLSNNQLTSIQLNPDPDWHGALSVPVTVSDGTDTSSPFTLTVDVNSIPDPTVYVDFDAGLPFSEGGLGTADNPLQTLGSALSEVSSGGTILIKGLTTSTESPVTIDQPVTLQNNNAMGETVTISPTLATRSLQSASTSTTGFVSRSSTQE